MPDHIHRAPTDSLRGVGGSLRGSNPGLSPDLRPPDCEWVEWSISHVVVIGPVDTGDKVRSSWPTGNHIFVVRVGRSKTTRGGSGDHRGAAEFVPIRTGGTTKLSTAGCGQLWKRQSGSGPPSSRAGMPCTHRAPEPGSAQRPKEMGWRAKPTTAATWLKSRSNASTSWDPRKATAAIMQSIRPRGVTPARRQVR